MIKIMIVDDMPIFLDYLYSCVDWEEYGFEICCEAKDGREAIEKFKVYEPDIVLADITMPYLDGLQMSEKLLSISKDIAIVLITGNSEFEYVRRAIKLGVYDYIVKPFEKEELIFTLLKIKDNINEMMEQKTEKEKMDMQKRDEVFRKLIYSQYKEDVLKEIGEQGIYFNFDHYLIGTIGISRYDENLESKMYQWENVIAKMLKDMLNIEQTCEVFSDYEGNIVTILGFPDEQEMQSFRGYEFLDLAKMVRQSLNYRIVVGISSYGRGIEQAYNCYQQTLQAMSHQYDNVQETIFYFKENNIDAKEFYSGDIIEEINRHLDTLNYEYIERVINKKMEIIEETIDYNFRTMAYMSLLSLLMSFIVKRGRNVEDVFEKDFHPYDILNSNLPHSQKSACILNCYKKAIEYLMQHIQSQSYQTAEQAKNYVENNYMNADLTIEDISRHLLINQTYLRRMFKSEMNMTISEYITNYRMETAKKLLEEGKYKIIYISQMTGYNDVGYFSKCFKKYYGKSPNHINITNKF